MTTAELKKMPTDRDEIERLIEDDRRGLDAARAKRAEHEALAERAGSSLRRALAALADAGLLKKTGDRSSDATGLIGRARRALS